MKRKLNLRKFIIFLVLVLFVAAGSTVRTVSVQAATYVKQQNTSVSITSKKTGWQKINGAIIFIIQKAE
jgi:predicted secreted protein